MSQSPRTWYTHSAKGKEGPFSLEDVQARVSSGDLKTQDYAWNQGMADWKKIQDIDELKPSTSASAPPPAPPRPSSPPVRTSGSEDGLSVLIEVKPSPTDDNTANLDLSALRNARKEAKKAAKVEKKAVKSVAPPVISKSLPRSSVAGATQDSAAPKIGKSKQRSLAVPIGIGVGLVATLGLGWMLIGGKVNWSSASFPKPGDLSEENHQLLKSAGSASLSEGGRIEVAVSNDNPSAPSFYLASNLADGTVFELLLDPLPATLAAEAKAIAPISVPTANHIGKTSAISLTPGYYWVYVFPPSQDPDSSKHWASAYTKTSAAPRASSGSPERKPILARKFFLGGPIEDPSYRTKLKEFHGARRTKTELELLSIQDSLKKLDLLLAAATQSSVEISRAKTPKEKEKIWKNYEANWSKNLAASESETAAPMSMLTRSHALVRTIQGSLRHLHEKNKALAVPIPGVTPGEAATESRLLSEEIGKRLTELKQNAEAMARRLAGAQSYIEEEKP